MPPTHRTIRKAPADLRDPGPQHKTSTVQPCCTHGSESVASVSPPAKDATDFAASPTTGQRYASQWTLEIPSLDSRLTVTATLTLQEI
jgi:hypothetical protein